MIEELHAWLKSQKDYKSSTGEACKYLYTKNPELKKILQMWNSSVADSYTIDTV
jgi:hypothetical protein